MRRRGPRVRRRVERRLISAAEAAEEKLGLKEALDQGRFFSEIWGKFEREFSPGRRADHLVRAIMYAAPAVAVTYAWAWVVNKLPIFSVSDILLVPVYFALLGVASGIALFLLAEVVGATAPPAAPRRELSFRYILRYALYLGMGYYVAPVVVFPFASYYAVFLYSKLAHLLLTWIQQLFTVFIMGVITLAGPIGLLLAVAVGAAFALFFPPVIVALVASPLLSRSARDLFTAYYFRPIVLAFLLRLAVVAGRYVGFDPAAWVGLVISVLTIVAGIRAALGDWGDIQKVPGYMLVWFLATQQVAFPNPAVPLMEYIASLYKTPAMDIALSLWKEALKLLFGW